MSTHQKALELNLDSSWYGSFAEIGAGQEVGRWFFRVGAAAGTVAKTMSAYDMRVSNAIYGETERYVSAPRLDSMLDHEYALNIERLDLQRGVDTRFFAFADTVAALRYRGTADCHAWMGIRFQSHPRSAPSDIVIHARLLDRDALMQQEALGILGVNLIYAAARSWDAPEAVLRSLSDELTIGRLEVDMVEFKGAAYAATDNRVMSLKLVEFGLTQVAMFDPCGNTIQPAEALYKKALVVQRGRFRPPTLVHADIQRKAGDALARHTGTDRDEIVRLVEMTQREIRSVENSGVGDFLDRIEALAAGNQPVVISNFERTDQLVDYLVTCRCRAIGIAMNAPELARLFSPESLASYADGVLELCHRIFRRGVIVLVYPAIDRETGARVEFADLAWTDETADLIAYLIRTGRLVALDGLNDEALRYRSDEVLERIHKGDPSWSIFVEPEVADVVRRKRLFDPPG